MAGRGLNFSHPICSIVGLVSVLYKAAKVGTDDLAVPGPFTSVCVLIENVSGAGSLASADGEDRKGSFTGDNTLGGVPK